jgi:hypothetical protein
MGWPSSVGVAQGLTNFAVKNCTCCELFTSALEMDGFGGREWIGSSWLRIGAGGGL